MVRYLMKPIKISFKEKDIKYLKFPFIYYINDSICKNHNWKLFDRFFSFTPFSSETVCFMFKQNALIGSQISNFKLHLISLFKPTWQDAMARLHNLHYVLKTSIIWSSITSTTITNFRTDHNQNQFKLASTYYSRSSRHNQLAQRPQIVGCWVSETERKKN